MLGDMRRSVVGCHSLAERVGITQSQSQSTYCLRRISYSTVNTATSLSTYFYTDEN